LQAVDISDPHNMVLTDASYSDLFCQMVTEMKPYIPDVLFAALWEEQGGLGTFDVSDGANIEVLDTLTRRELEKSNRVKIFDNYAILPLEQDPGGIAFVDVSNVEDLHFIGLAQDVLDLTSPYTAEVKGNYLYAFSADENAMSVFEILRHEPEAVYGIWDLSGTSSPEELRTGIVATQGTGTLTVIDPEQTGGGSTISRMNVGSTNGVSHLRLDGSDGWSESNGLFLKHGLEDLFYGSLTSYTLVWDIVVPEDSFGFNGCSSSTEILCDDIPLYQLDRRNDNDADLFLKVGSTGWSDNGFIGKSGDVFTGGGLGGYTEAIQPDDWMRIAFVIDLYGESPQATIYIDGVVVQQTPEITYALFSPVAEGDPWATDLLTEPDGFFLFADNDGEMDTEVGVSGVLFANRALSATEVSALGVANGSPIPAPW
jgi:hypothetical protein